MDLSIRNVDTTDQKKARAVDLKMPLKSVVESKEPADEGEIEERGESHSDSTLAPKRLGF